MPANSTLANWAPMNPGESPQRPLRPALFGEPPRAFGNQEEHEQEKDRREGPDAEHPAPAVLFVPALVALGRPIGSRRFDLLTGIDRRDCPILCRRVIRQIGCPAIKHFYRLPCPILRRTVRRDGIIDKVGCEHPENDGQLVDGYHHAPQAGRGDFGDIHRRTDRCRTDGQAGDDSKEDKNGDAPRQGRTECRDKEQDPCEDRGSSCGRAGRSRIPRQQPRQHSPGARWRQPTPSGTPGRGRNR